jgi:(heptosyl)LPS beta-1,4-glucosyltransferase
MTKDEGRTHDPESQVAAIILTKNEEFHIGACLDSLAWADRRVVFDSFSSDRTGVIAREHGAVVMQHPFADYASQRNAAMDAVEAGWIFFVDADERATPELADEIRTVVAEPGNVTGWYVPRDNYLFGKLTRGAGYWPDYQMRLLQRGRTRYERPASEIVVMDGESDYLKHPLVHYNYESLAQFHAKQQFRIDFEASNLYRQGVRPKFYTPLTQPLRHFWWRYVTLKGYRDGLHGLRLSILLAYYFGYRYYVRLAQMCREKTRD